jgi:hypothetical protein
MISSHLFSILLVIQAQAAVSPFNGSWVMDFVPRKDAKPESFSVSDDVFSRGSGKLIVSVKVDGYFHSIQSDGYVDAVAARIISPREIVEKDRFKGKLVYSINYIISPDGSEMIRKVVDYSKPDGHPISTTIVSRRIGKSRRGKSLISGSWQTFKTKTNRSHLTEKMKLNGLHFSSSMPGGAGYDAIVGGPPVPVRGDAADARVAVNMPSDRIIVLDMSRNGKVTVHKTMTLSSDSQTINVNARRLSDGVDTNWMLHKQ